MVNVKLKILPKILYNHSIRKNKFDKICLNLDKINKINHYSTLKL